MLGSRGQHWLGILEYPMGWDWPDLGGETSLRSGSRVKEMKRTQKGAVTLFKEQREGRGVASVGMLSGL